MHITACIEFRIMYKSLLTDSTVSLLYLTSHHKSTKGAPTVPQARCMLRRVSIDGSFHLHSPNLCYFLPFFSIIWCLFFFFNWFPHWRKENYDYNKAEKRISFFGSLASQLNCLLHLNSVHWSSVSCLWENSEGGIWTHPPLQPADQAEEVIDTFMFTLNHTGK